MKLMASKSYGGQNYKRFQNKLGKFIKGLYPQEAIKSLSPDRTLKAKQLNWYILKRIMGRGYFFFCFAWLIF